MATRPPQVSVLMTAYNRESFIAEAIESVLASSFGSFELVIVDDGSTDATIDVARSYEGDKRVKVFMNRENLGDYPNRNRAASLASGDYLKFVDSDDVIYPHGLQVMVDAMLTFPDAALALERPPSTENRFPTELQPQAAYDEHFLGGGLFSCGPIGTIIRSAAFRAVGGFSGKRFVGDTEMWLKLGARYPTVKLTQGLVWWRVHEGQEFQLGHTSLAYGAGDYQVALAALGDPACPLDEQDRVRALYRLTMLHRRSVLRKVVREGHPLAALKIMRDTDVRGRDLVMAVARSQRWASR